MKKVFINLVVFMLVLLISCSGQKYFNKVKKHIKEFDFVMNHLQTKKEFSKIDSISLKDSSSIRMDKNICVYDENMDDLITRNFTKKNDLTRICFSRLNNEFFDSVITFHKEFTPFFGKAVTIIYDFGKSKLREDVKNGILPKNEDVRIINDFYLYRVKSHPELGE